MKTLPALGIVLGLAAALPAHAYCIHNELADREVRVEQEPLRDRLREGRELRLTLKPGQRECCRNLDCNPGGRSESTVGLTISVPGEPAYGCAPGGVGAVKVTGDGLVRIVPNPNRRSASPYVIRIRSGQKDLTGPRGLPCLEPRKKGTP